MIVLWFVLASSAFALSPTITVSDDEIQVHVLSLCVATVDPLGKAVVALMVRPMNGSVTTNYLVCLACILCEFVIVLFDVCRRPATSQGDQDSFLCLTCLSVVVYSCS